MWIAQAAVFTQRPPFLVVRTRRAPRGPRVMVYALSSVAAWKERIPPYRRLDPLWESFWRGWDHFDVWDTRDDYLRKTTPNLLPPSERYAWMIEDLVPWWMGWERGEDAVAKLRFVFVGRRFLRRWKAYVLRRKRHRRKYFEVLAMGAMFKRFRPLHHEDIAWALAAFL